MDLRKLSWKEGQHYYFLIFTALDFLIFTALDFLNQHKIIDCSIRVYSFLCSSMVQFVCHARDVFVVLLVVFVL